MLVGVLLLSFVFEFFVKIYNLPFHLLVVKKRVLLWAMILVLVLTVLLILFVSNGFVKIQGFVIAENPESILFLGDTSFVEKAGKTNEEYPGYHIQNFENFLSASDYVIANLETPITELSDSPHIGKKVYIRKESPSKLTVYKENGIDIFSLANNHMMDYGEEGFLDTLKYLDDRGLKHFGADINEQSIEPFILNTRHKKIAMISAIEHQTRLDRDFDFYATEEKTGVFSLNSDKLIDQIKNIKTNEPDTIVIVLPHWGINYRWKIERQNRKAEELINAGADLIIGHGAHMMQEIEFIDDKPVIYSIGDFVHNIPGNYSLPGAVPYSLIAGLFLIEDRMELRLYPIFSDNLRTDYQPRFVSDEEFIEVKDILETKSSINLETGKNSNGNYFVIIL